MERVHKSSPLLGASTSFKTDWPLQVSRSLETGNALDTLGMRRKKKKNPAETQGISRGSEAGCSISPSFKNYCQALRRLGPMCLAGNNGSQLELMKQLSANLAINQLSKFLLCMSCWQNISLGKIYTGAIIEQQILIASEGLWGSWDRETGLLSPLPVSLSDQNY